jgi:23S rRNA (uracil1939-C5)-methyltransferase
MKIHCPHATRCAGCPAIELPPDEQLTHKRDRVARAFARYPALELAIDETVPADPTTGYRVRAKLVAQRGRLGLFAKNEDHVVVDIPECQVLTPRLAKAADVVRRAQIPGLRAVDLREADRVLITLILDDGTDPDPEAILAIDPDASIAIAYQAPDHPQLLGRGLRVLRDGPVRDEIADGVWTYAAHGAFVQAHRGQAARIYREIRDATRPEGARVIDVFAGSGAIGLMLAKAGANVLAIEAFPPAAERAREAATAQGLALDVVIGDAAQEIFRAKNADVIVLDPPRRGVEPELRLACAGLGPRTIVMLSCEPETLARDLDHFARLGYHATRARPFDLMPLTDEVETLAILERGEPLPPAILFRDERLVVLEKSAFEPTTPQDGTVRSLLERARSIPGLERAVPLHRLDGGTSGVCAFATAPEHAGELAKAMHDKRYVALARGIARLKGTVNRPLLIDGAQKSARTTYRRRAVVHGHSLLEVRIDTGRTHQIRRHLAMIGHPILGDARYGHEPSNRHFANKHFLDRPFLHCVHLAIGNLVIESPLPGELARLLEQN